MAAVVGITLVKYFAYRADLQEEWSNQYWLTGAVPADTAAWDSLRDNLVTQEKTCLPSTVKYARAYGYDSDADNASAVYVHDWGTGGPTGTVTIGTNDRQMPGDVAVLVEWKTSRLTDPGGKRIYLRKYFHGALQENTNPDFVTSEQNAACNAFATKMRDGTFASGRTLRSRLHDETLIAGFCTGYLTTRTLKRRGKRPGA